MREKTAYKAPKNTTAEGFSDTAYTLLPAAKTGYTFGGWYTSSKLKAGTEITEILPGRTANLTLYAKWIRE